MIAYVIIVLVSVTVIATLLLNATITHNPVYNFVSSGLHLCNQLFYRNLININPAKITKITTNHNVVFLMCHDLDSLPDYAIKSKYIFKKYCKQHSYEFVNLKYPKHIMSPYWIRVDALIKLLQQYPKDTIFVYVDLDTCINPHWFDKSLDDMLSSLDTDNTYDIYVGKEPMPTRILNSGVIILRNTDWTQDLLQEWRSRYDPNCWFRRNGKWVCEQNGRKCAWAGDQYEQGALNNIYRENWNNTQSHMAILHSDVISNNFRRCSRSYIYHLMTQKDHWRSNFFKEMITDINEKTCQ